jgi:subtilisin family serine protease
MGVVAPGGEIRAYYPDGWQYTAASGSSPATALTAGAIALVMSRWPEATPNQVLQSVIRNTGAEPHELEHTDEYGYGFLNLPRLLETDPTQYEDVNPLIADDAELGPDVATIFGAPTDEPTAGDSGGGADTPVEDAPSGMSTIVVLALVALAVLAVAGVTIALVVSARRRRTAPAVAPPTPGHSTFDAVNRGEHHG